MKKRISLIIGISTMFILSGCIQNEQPEEPIPSIETDSSPKVETSNRSTISEEERQKIKEQELIEQQVLEETRKRVKEQVQYQKEQRKKQQETQQQSTKATNTNTNTNTTKDKANDTTKDKAKDKITEVTKDKITEVTKDKVKDKTKDTTTNPKQEDKKGKEMDTKETFRAYQTVFETYVKESVGKDLTVEGLNKYLGSKMQVSGTDLLQLTSSKKNQWGNPYKVEINQKEQKIIIRSLGEEKKEYILATYYQNGVVATCMSGFETDNLLLSLTLQKGQVCGGNLK